MSKVEFTTVLEKFDSNLWKHYISVPGKFGDPFIEGNNRRVVCTFNGRESVQCALMPREDGYFILVNQQLKNKLGVEVGQELQITLEKDHSEFGHPVPESFRVLLEQDEEARHYFEGLTKANQRSLVYLVSKIKNVDKQISRGLAILEHVRESKGNLNYRGLNETIKRYNQMDKLK